MRLRLLPLLLLGAALAGGLPTARAFPDGAAYLNEGAPVAAQPALAADAAPPSPDYDLTAVFGGDVLNLTDAPAKSDPSLPRGDQNLPPHDGYGRRATSLGDHDPLGSEGATPAGDATSFHRPGPVFDGGDVSVSKHVVIHEATGVQKEQSATEDSYVSYRSEGAGSPGSKPYLLAPAAYPPASYRPRPALSQPVPANTYGAPAVPAKTYGAPAVPAKTYGAPAVPAKTYGAPAVPLVPVVSSVPAVPATAEIVPAEPTEEKKGLLSGLTDAGAKHFKKKAKFAKTLVAKGAAVVKGALLKAKLLAKSKLKAELKKKGKKGSDDKKGGDDKKKGAKGHHEGATATLHFLPIPQFVEEPIFPGPAAHPAAPQGLPSTETLPKAPVPSYGPPPASLPGGPPSSLPAAPRPPLPYGPSYTPVVIRPVQGLPLPVQGLPVLVQGGAQGKDASKAKGAKEEEEKKKKKKFFGVLSGAQELASGVQASLGAALSRLNPLTWFAGAGPEPALYSPEPAVYNPEPEVHSPEPEVHSPEPVFYNPEPAMYNPEPEVHSPEPVFYNPEAAVYNPESVGYNPGPAMYSPVPPKYSPEPSMYSPGPAQYNPEAVRLVPFAPAFITLSDGDGRTKEEEKQKGKGGEDEKEKKFKKFLSWF